MYDHTKINAKVLPARTNDAKIVEKIDIADDFIYLDINNTKTFFFFMKIQPFLRESKIVRSYQNRCKISSSENK